MGCSPSTAKLINAKGSGGSTPGPTEKGDESPDAYENPRDYSLIEEKTGTIDNILEFLGSKTKLASESKETEEEEDDETLDKLTQLHELYDMTETPVKHEQFSNYLVERDFPALYRRLHKEWRSAQTEGKKSGGLGLYELGMALELATMVLGNACDSSAVMCRAVGKAGLIELLLGELRRMQKDDDGGGRQERYDQDSYLELVLSTLHNSIRLCNDNRRDFRDAEAVALLQHFLQLDRLLYRALALLTLSYIIDDEENHKINAGNENIEFLVNVLESAVDEDDHREGDYGFHVTELVDGMTKLAFNDDNKVTIVRAGVLPSLVKLLQPQCSLEEQRLAATALWTLAFHKDNKDKIRKETGCLTALEKLKSEPDPGLKRACEGALWELKEQEVSLEQQREDFSSMQDNRGSGGSMGHVMISYSWNVQSRIVKLKKKLQSAGYAVWMDIEKMGGSTLEAMAEAVQGADVVLICMSEKYKFSNPCRSEAEYTYKLQKPYIPIRVEKNYSPDGWLGILVGTKLYFDFSSEENLEKNFPNLVREIGERGKVRDTVVKKYDLNVAQSGNDRNVNIVDKTPEDDSLASWDNSDITSWLSKIGLGHLAPKFKKYTGRQLLTLKKICLEAPEFFYASLKKDLGFKDLYDIARFKEELEDLN